jgi:catechol 2,3-dioxygenase-like lactoylglutathione lyase family enzyme
MNTETSSRTLPSAAGIVPKKLAHLVLKTSNYEAMVDWYLKVLNARVALAVPHVSFLTFDDEHHRIAIVKVPRLAKHDANTCGMDHIAFTYGDLGDLLATYKRLAAQGIRPRWPINHGMTVSFYYQDPDGNHLELQIDSFPTAKELQDYFEHDPGYAANPLGAEFDPDELIRKYEAGVPLAELIKVPPLTRSPFAVLQEMGLGKDNV